MPRTFMDHQAKWFPEGSLADLPDIEGDARAAAASWAGRWSPATWSLPHAGAACRRRRRRRPAAARVLGALPRRRHAPRAAALGHLAATFPAWPSELPAGAPMDDPLFPLLWERAHDAGMRCDCRLRSRSPGATAAARRASCWPGRAGRDWALAHQRGRHRRRRAVLGLRRRRALVRRARRRRRAADARRRPGARVRADDAAAALRRRRGRAALRRCSTGRRAT